ncbi:MAG: PAS domain S-box protein [bacterium]|nr:PAS domain S-box protein [bacterium]
MKETNSISRDEHGQSPQSDGTSPSDKSAFFAEFVESLPQPVFEIDTNRRVTFANQAALDMFEWSDDDLAAGFDAHRVVAPEHADLFAEALQRALQGESLQGLELLFRAKSGRAFPGAVYCARVQSGDRTLVRGFVTDITERKASEELLRIQRDLNQELTQAADIQEAFNLVLEFILRLEHVESGGIYLVDESGGLRLISHAGLSPEFVRAVEYCAPDSDRAQVGRSGKPIYVCSTDKLQIPDRDIRKEGLRALAIIPIMFSEKVLAVMIVAAHHICEFPPSTRYALESIASRLGGIVSRLKTLQTLHESEARFRSMAEQMMDVLYTTDAGGIITYISPSAQQIFGWLPQDMIGKAFVEFVTDEEIRRAMFAFQSAMTTGMQLKNLALRLKRKDDSTFLGEVSGVFTAQQGEQAGTVGIIRNVTGFRDTEEELRVSRDRLKMAIEGGNIGLWDWNLVTNQVYFSPEWKKQIGYRDDEIANKYKEWEDRLHPEDRESTLSSLKASQTPPYPPYRVEFRLRHKDGSYRWIMARGTLQFDDHGQPARVMGTNVDITERKRTEEALLENRRELRQTLEATTDGIWSWNLQTDTWWFSPRYYTMLDYKPGEFPASFESWRNLIHPNDLNSALQVVEKYLKTKPDTYENEYRLRTSRGDYRWIHARARCRARPAR